MTKQEKQKIETALINAYDNTLKEQDIHRERISAMEKLGNKDFHKELSSIGSKGIIKAMADECSPACSQDRQQLLEQNWDQIPSRIRIDQIEDKDIRHRTYFLGEVVDHCSRIKSIAKFFEVLGASPDDSYANMLYEFWCKHHILSVLANEQLEEGNQEKAKSLRQAAKATVGIMDVFINNPEMSKKIPIKIEIR